MTLAQSRHLATAIPRRKSLSLQVRKEAAVIAVVRTTMPVHARRTTGGIIEDVDGSRLIDLLFLPALTISDELVHEGLDIIASAFSEL